MAITTISKDMSLGALLVLSQPLFKGTHFVLTVRTEECYSLFRRNNIKRLQSLK